MIAKVPEGFGRRACDPIASGLPTARWRRGCCRPEIPAPAVRAVACLGPSLLPFNFPPVFPFGAT